MARRNTDVSVARSVLAGIGHIIKDLENIMQTKTISSAIALLCIASSAAFAQTKAPEPDYTLSYNLGATTDYRYRGISQSRLKPALQGGADFAMKNGFYLGAWGSTINWVKDAGALSTPSIDTGNAPVEIDLYGGYKGKVGELDYDVGALQYYYPGNKYSNIPGAANANTLELYGAITFGVVTAKYSHSLSNLFGFKSATANSKGSGYLDVSANFDLGNGWSVVPHVGHQTVRNFGDYSYTDYSATVNKDIDGLVLSAAIVGTDAKKNVAGNVNSLAYASPGGKNLGRTGLVLSVKKNF
jgi:uncharacterized protein (TIGR02001 family)